MHIGKLLSVLILTLACSALAFAQASPSPSPTESPSASPSPSPTPACLAADLTAFAACVAACDAATPDCAGQGSLDAFVAFLKSSLANCSFPGLDKERDINGLKKLANGLSQLGALSPDDRRLLNQEINACRKAMHKHHNEDNNGG